MKLTILTDNSAAPYFCATHGFSCYIESDINVLFDVGPDDTFIKNARIRNVNLQPHYTVLSHGHWDHGNGLLFAPKGKLVCHPACFTKRYSKVKNMYNGLEMSESQLSFNQQIIKTKEPLKLSDKVWFLGEIPRLNDFEAQRTDFVDDKGNDDFIPDDSALAIQSDKGLVIVSGCAHAGICNTVEYAIKVTGISKVSAVFGGFHLKSGGEATRRTIEFFKKLNINEVHPSHCTSLPALTEFYAAFRQPQVLAGNYYTFI